MKKAVRSELVRAKCGKRQKYPLGREWRLDSGDGFEMAAAGLELGDDITLE